MDSVDWLVDLVGVIGSFVLAVPFSAMSASDSLSERRAKFTYYRPILLSAHHDHELQNYESCSFSSGKCQYLSTQSFTWISLAGKSQN